MATPDELRRWDPAQNMPPGTPINSKGMPYSPDLDTMSPQEKANVAASMQAINSQGFSSASSTTSSEQPSYAGGGPGALATPAAPASSTPATPAPSAPAATAQSEPVPKAKPPITPRPYQWFKENDPVIAGWIDNAAQATGASPERLAAHKWLESGKGRTSGRGADGEIGVMQFMPSTWRQVDPHGQLDPNNGQQAMMLAGTLINQLDSKYGKDTPLSIARYNGSGPQAEAYARRMLPGGVSDSDFTAWEGGSATPHGLMLAAQDGGPPAFLRYMVDTTPQAMSMTDKWRNVEGMLVQAALAKGDIAGAEHARDFVSSMAYTGTNQHLMAAHNALAAGQGVVAAQHLAAAHAFFPDGTMGRFSSDGKSVYAERVDEDDPSRSFGSSQITPEAVAGLLNQTHDPQQFLKTLLAQQHGAAANRLAQMHGDYYAQKPAFDQQKLVQQSTDKALHEQGLDQRAGMHEQSVDARFAQGEANKDTRLNTQEAGRTARAGMRDGAGGAIDKETASVYDPTMHPNDPNLGRKSIMFDALRHNQVPGPMAQQIVEGLTSGGYQIRVSPDKTQAGVFDKQGQPLAYLPPALLQRFAGPIAVQPRQAPAPAMVGAPAAMPMSLGAGAVMRPNPMQPPAGALQYYGAAPSSSDEEEEEE